MLRQLRRHRAFAGTLIAVLAIGVAVTTAMFSIVYCVLLGARPVVLANTLVVGAAMLSFWRDRRTAPSQ